MKRLQLSTLKDGARFVYGGVEWVKLEHLYTESGKLETVAIAAEPVFERAFDEENCNDWRKSSLRRELNGPFLDTLIAGIAAVDQGAGLSRLKKHNSRKGQDRIFRNGPDFRPLIPREPLPLPAGPYRFPAFNLDRLHLPPLMTARVYTAILHKGGVSVSTT